MIMRGQKRKLPPEDQEDPDRTSPNWETQRQFVFSVSLSKYQRSQELVEPSLRRSVLIANTLRQVSLGDCGSPSADEEAEQPSFSSSSAPQVEERDGLSAGGSPMVSLNYASDCPSGSPPACPSSESNVPMSVEDEDEDWGSMSTDSDLALSAAISSILTALDSTIDSSPQAAPRTPLRSLENLSGPFEGGASWVKQGSRDCGVGWEQQQEEEEEEEERRMAESSVEVMRSSYLSDLTVEDLFQDIDTSLLERDMGVLGLISGGGGYPAGDDLLQYLPPFSPSLSSSLPFSLSLNPSLKCLPSFSSFSPLSPSSSPALSLPASSSFSGQNLMRDGFELENLMEILVES